MHKSSPPPADSKSLKLAQKVAMQIEEDILASGWKVGEMIGSEAELAVRYGVSRWIIREAIGITEQDGLVEIRRGRRGGIAVSAPVLSVVGSSIRRFLSVSRISCAELYEARLVFEGFAASLACQRLDATSIQSLRELLDRATGAPKEQHLQLAYRLLRGMLGTAGNSALEVFAYSLAQVTTYLALLRGISEEELLHLASRLIVFRVKLVEAILANDMDDAREQIEQFLKLSLKGLLKPVQNLTGPSRLAAQRQLGLGPRTTTARPKLTEQVAWQIECDLVANDWAPGTLLGSESDLIQRYQVSRSVIREAIRPLEHLGAIEMCRGKSSGLKVTEPDPTAIVRSVVLYLSYSKNDDFVSYDLRKAIELVVVGQLAAATPTVRRQVSARLGEFAAQQYSPSLASQRQLVHRLGRILADSAANRVFSFFLRILAETVLLSSRCTLSAADAAVAMRTVQDRALELGEAIEAGSAEAARECIEHIWSTLREVYELPKRSARLHTAA